MSANIKLDFGTFLRACFVDYKAQLPDGKISEAIWIEKVNEWHTAWLNYRKPAKRTRKALPDAEWLASLKVDPALAGVAVETEIAKCQFWCRNQTPPVQPSRRRIVNWLNKADRTLPRGAPQPVHQGPVGWLAWMRANRPDWRRFVEEAEGHPVPSWAGLTEEERKLILSIMS